MRDATPPEDELKALRRELARLCAAPLADEDHERYGLLLAHEALLLLTIRETGESRDGREQRIT